MEAFITVNSPNIIGLTEVLPKNSIFQINETYFNLENYDLFTTSLDKRRGVVLYIQKKFCASSVTITTNFEEVVLCKFSLKNKDNLLVACIYRSPNSPRESFVELKTLFSKIRDLKYSHILLMGDFNIEEINWVDMSTTVGEDHIAYLFLETVRDCFFYQHVTEPTRIREQNTPSVLDLILTNEENMVSNLQYIQGLGRSDHLVLSFNFNCYVNTTLNPSFKKRNFFKGDYLSINTSLQSINWEVVLNGLDSSQSWSFLAEHLIQLLEKYIPESKVGSGGDGKNPIITKSCLDAIKVKHQKWLKYKYCMTSSNYSNYKSARNKVTGELRKAKYNYEKDLSTRINSDNKIFWSYVRSKTKVKSSVCKLQNQAGGLTETDQETADILNNFFASVFEREGSNPLPAFEQREFLTELTDIHITEEHVITTINQLNPSKSQGPDQIHPKLIKEIKDVIVTPLTIIFQKSLAESKIPENWKEAHITAIFKKGVKSCPENYRPISLTSVPGKMMEKNY